MKYEINYRLLILKNFLGTIMKAMGGRLCFEQQVEVEVVDVLGGPHWKTAQFFQEISGASEMFLDGWWKYKAHKTT